MLNGSVEDGIGGNFIQFFGQLVMQPYEQRF